MKKKYIPIFLLGILSLQCTQPTKTDDYILVENKGGPTLGYSAASGDRKSVV